MRTKVITVATSEGRGLDALRSTLKGEDFEILGMDTEWRGFGTKIILLREYLQTLEGYTHFIFTDAYDTLFLEPVSSLEYKYSLHYRDKIVFSAEKNCYPDHWLAPFYPPHLSEWKYLNSGNYIAPIKKYLDMLANFPVVFADDDQRYFTDIFLTSDRISLDYPCILFQSIAFAGDDFEWKHNALRNKKTSQYPSVAHGNGKTPMGWILKNLNNESKILEAS